MFKKALFLVSVLLFALIGKTQSQSLDSQLNDVRKFGAKGDGVTDDTEAIQTAINTSKGKPVYISSGTYLISKTLNAATKSDIVLLGSDLKNCKLVATKNLVGTMIYVPQSITISNITFQGSGKEGCYGISSSEGNHRVLMQNLYFTSFDYGIKIDGTSEFPLNCKLDNIYIQNVLTCGIKLGTDSQPKSGQSLLELNNIVVTNPTLPGTLYNNNNNNPINLRGYAQQSDFGWSIMKKVNPAKDPGNRLQWETVKIISNKNFTRASAGNIDTSGLKVVKCTVGIYIANFKAVNAGVLQCEYLGIGSYFYKCVGVHLGSMYYEYRANFDSPIPRGIGLVIQNCRGFNVSSGWAENAYSAITIINSASVKVSSIVTSQCSRSIINVYNSSGQKNGNQNNDLVFDTLSSNNSLPKVTYNQEF
jgi:hypothetical protein